MTLSKPRLAIVCSHNSYCTNAYHGSALLNFLSGSFDVEMIDLQSYQLLMLEGESCRLQSEAHINQICKRLQTFDIVNVQLELGLFGKEMEDILLRVCKICQASKRLILTMHRVDSAGENSKIYNSLLHFLKYRPSSNPFHILVHLPREKKLIEEIYKIENVTDFPVIFLSNQERERFQQQRNQKIWKEQFGLKEEDITIGLFGILNSYKNYTHALKTLKLLPTHYKLLIIGETSPANVKEFQVDPVVKEMTSFLDDHPKLANRVIFTGKRKHEQFNEDLANVDFVMLPYFEVGQSASAAFSNALELSCATLMSNTCNCKEYEIYFPDCFEIFDIGNYYETKHKILNFDMRKIENLKSKIGAYSEEQLREIYLKIYADMKKCVPIAGKIPSLYSKPTRLFAVKKILIKILPSPIKAILKKARRKLLCQ